MGSHIVLLNNGTVGHFRVSGALFDLFQPLGLLNRSSNVQSLLLESCDKGVKRHLKANVRIHFNFSEKLFLLGQRIPLTYPVIPWE